MFTSGLSAEAGSEEGAKKEDEEDGGRARKDKEREMLYTGRLYVD